MLELTADTRLGKAVGRARSGARSRRHRPRGGLVPGRLLLARPRRLHLEHQDHGRQGRRFATCSRRSLPTSKPSNWAIAEARRVRSRRRDRGWITFETERRRAATAMIRAEGRPDLDAADHDGRTEGPRGAGSASTRPLGAKHGVRQAPSRPGRKSARRRRRRSATRRSPMCSIIGGGQGGIALGARLRQLGVPTIIVEKNERAGDSWRKRYKSLCLHDPVWYDHLPYMPISRRTGRCSRPRTRSATGWRCTPRSWS